MAARVREVVWTESDRDALDEVLEYIAQDSQSAAVKVLDQAIQAAASLATFSERGRIRYPPQPAARFPMQYRNFAVRMKICPSEIAGELSV